MNIASGQPKLQLYGRAAEVLKEKTPAEHHLIVHISLADTESLANALVIIEAIRDVKN